MNFRPRQKHEPEINLIPFIDVLLVILIFLMLSTTYNKFTEMPLKLPVADTDAQRDYAREVNVAISSEGLYAINKTPVGSLGAADLALALADAAKADKDMVLIISADANATHQSVLTAMEAARRSGLSQITFASQPSAQAGAR